MTFTYSNSLEFSLQICFIYLKKFLKKINVTEDFISLGCFSISLKRLFLKIMVFLWIFSFPSICMNFSISSKHLKTFPWWNVTAMMPFLFVRRISSYSLMILAASSSFSTLSARSFISSISTALFIVMDSNSCFFISSLSRRVVFLLVLEFPHS